MLRYILAVIGLWLLAATIGLVIGCVLAIPLSMIMYKKHNHKVEKVEGVGILIDTL